MVVEGLGSVLAGAVVEAVGVDVALDASWLPPVGPAAFMVVVVVAFRVVVDFAMVEVVALSVVVDFTEVVLVAFNVVVDFAMVVEGIKFIGGALTGVVGVFSTNAE